MIFKYYCSRICLFCLLMLVVSCEGPRYISLQVIDKTTQKPIDQVKIHVVIKRGKDELYNYFANTDSLGNFQDTKMISTSLSVSKVSYNLTFTKLNFKEKVVLNKLEGKVELHK